MRLRRIRLLIALAVAGLAAAIVAVSFYHWWYGHRFTDFANLKERTQVRLAKLTGGGALSPDGRRMYILQEPEKGQGYVRVFDTDTVTEVGSVELEPGFPFSLAITPDGRRLLAGVSRFRGGSGTKGENRVDLIDAVTGTVTGKVRIPGRCASFVALTQDGTSAYVSERTSKYIDRVDLAANRLSAKIEVHGGPFAIVMKHGTDLAYVVSGRGGNRTTVSAIDMTSDTIVASVATDLKKDVQPSEAHFSQRGDRLYVIHPQDSRIAVIDTDPESPTYHQQSALIDTRRQSAWRMCFNRDTTLAWVLVKPWELALLDTDPASPRYHTIVERRPTGFDCRFLLHEPPDAPMTLYLFDSTNGVIRVLSPSGN